MEVFDIRHNLSARNLLHLSLVPTYEINLFLEEEIILIYEINVRDYSIRLSVLIACVPTKLYYKYQMFL